MRKDLTKTHSFEGVQLRILVHKKGQGHYLGTILDLPVIMVEADSVPRLYEKMETSFKFFITHTVFPLLCDIGLEYDLKKRWLIKSRE